jgi:predicted MFS family arabinose efflux permease
MADQEIGAESESERAGGGVQVVMSGAMLIGLVIGGSLGETLGLRATLLVAGSVALLGAGGAALSPLRSVHSLGELSRP